MRPAELGLQSTVQILVDQDGVEMHWRLRHTHALAAGGDA